MLGCIINYLITGFAKDDWHVYVALIFSVTGFSVMSISRSIMTKLVGPLEIGKVLAVIGCIQVSNLHDYHKYKSLFVHPYIPFPLTLYSFYYHQFPEKMPESSVNEIWNDFWAAWNAQN